MIRGAWFMGALAIACLGPAAAAQAQANFGPIQPFAGAPSPVYVAAPYAAPTAFAPVPAAPVFSTTPTEIQILAPTVAPSIVAPPAATVIPAQPSYCPTKGLPTTSYYAPTAVVAPTTVVLGTGLYGQPTAYVPGQPVRNYLRYVSP